LARACHVSTAVKSYSRATTKFLRRLGDGEIDSQIRKDRLSIWLGCVALLACGIATIAFAGAVSQSALLGSRADVCAYVASAHPDPANREGPAASATASLWPLGIDCSLDYASGETLSFPTDGWTMTVVAGIGMVIVAAGIVGIPAAHLAQRRTIDELSTITRRTH
jgi:hypothetical protein